MSEFDPTLDRIGRFVADVVWSDLRPDDVAGIIDHVYDTIGCAYGGIGSDPVAMARRIALAAPVADGATVIGSSTRVAPEYAVFANAAMVRALDYNDSCLGPGGGHPSDALAAVLAAAEIAGASGAQFLLAVHAAYEVFAAMTVVELRPRGWDHTWSNGLAAAAGAAKALGLSSEQVSNAVAMIVVSSLSLGVTRVGPLAHWKGLAAASAAMNGHFASRLAGEGITGPPIAFDGAWGFWEVFGARYEVPVPGALVDGRSAVQRSFYKLFAAEYNAQGLISVLVDLFAEGIRPADIASIVVRTFDVCYTEIGGGQGDHDDKWDPKTPEDADHSAAYMMAVALTDGDVGPQSYTPERIADPTLRPLMNRISVELRDDPSANWGKTMTLDTEPFHDIEINLTDGSTRNVRSSFFARGHFNDPATPEDLERKFTGQVRPVLGAAGCDELAEAIRDLPNAPDLSRLLEILRRPVAAV